MIAKKRSGDHGVGCNCSVSNNVPYVAHFPASSPYVTSVGGTISRPTVHGVEMGINFSGGGFSNNFQRLSYQQSVVSSFLSTYASPLPPSPSPFLFVLFPFSFGSPFPFLYLLFLSPLVPPSPSSLFSLSGSPLPSPSSFPFLFWFPPSLSFFFFLSSLVSPFPSSLSPFPLSSPFLVPPCLSFFFFPFSFGFPLPFPSSFPF